MKKTYCIIIQLILLLWFFLDMTGLYFGNSCLVSRSYKDDGIFFLIYLIVVTLFVVKEQIGKWFVIVWLAIWFAIQFICHEWYTIFNDGFMGKIISANRTLLQVQILLENKKRWRPCILKVSSVFQRR